MAVQKIITQRVDLRLQDGRDRLEWPNVLAVKGDSYAHLWRVELLDNGSPANLSGHTAQCYVINGANTVPLTAAISENVISVAFPPACYAQAGDMKCLMSVISTGGSPTVALLRLKVLDSITDVLIDPDDVIPSVSELMEIVATLSGVAASENARAAAEEARAAAEGLRVPAESARISAEQARVTAETLRQSAETLRASAESARQTAESGRASAESTRQTAEGGRVSAESARQTTEGVRASAETQRASDTSTSLSAVGSATTAANAAAGAANTAAGTASAAATAANTAAGAANAATYEIDGMTIEVAVVPYGTTPVGTVTEVEGHKHISLQVQRGPQGPGYTIKGTAYATLTALEAAVPNPAEGDQYNVGSAAPYHVYRWTGLGWEDQGELQGPDGDDGFSPLASVGKLGKTATISITDKIGNTSAQITDGNTFTPAVSSGGVLSFTNDGGQSNPAPVDLAAAAAAAVPAVRYDVDQSGTYDATQKARARANMGAQKAISTTGIAKFDGAGNADLAVAGVDYPDATALIAYGYGIINGCGVSAQGAPNQSVAVAAGSAISPTGKRITVNANATMAAATADATNPRYDIVSAPDADADGIVDAVYTAGVAASSPTVPVTPSGHTLLALLYRVANDNAISASEITDSRVYIPTANNVISAFGEIGYSTFTTVYGQVSAIRKPNGRYDVLISAVPFAITRTGTEFGFLSNAKIVALLGLRGALSWPNYNSRVSTTAAIATSYIDKGLVLKNDDAGVSIWLGRVYGAAGAIGAWPLSETSFFVLNAQYIISIYDAVLV